MTNRERTTSKIIGAVLGVIIGLTLFVILPMRANYLDHGSVFIAQPKDQPHDH